MDVKVAELTDGWQYRGNTRCFLGSRALRCRAASLPCLRHADLRDRNQFCAGRCALCVCTYLFYDGRSASSHLRYRTSFDGYSPFIFSLKARLKIHDLGRELRVVLALPIGYVCGYALTWLVSAPQTL